MTAPRRKVNDRWAHSASPRAKRLEFRPPGPSANPYLAFAAMLVAGLDGIQRRIDPGLPVYDI